jgi:hypothetical protein
LRPNALFLSTAAAAGQPELSELFSWFGRNFLLADAESRHSRHLYTADLIARGEHQTNQVLSLLRAADLGVVGVRRQEMDPAMLERVHRVFRAINEEMGSPDDGPFTEVTGLTLSHHGANGSYDLASEEESLGTMVWLGMAGPVVAALERGSVFLADEIDASLHPSLVSQLVRMFQNPRTNPNRAQIIFNSHEVTLLGDSASDRQLGRDQVWFTEKTHDGASRLYPLSALDPRKDEAVGRRYLAGRYGGLPIVASGDFEAAAELITSGTER